MPAFILKKINIIIIFYIIVFTLFVNCSQQDSVTEKNTSVINEKKYRIAFAYFGPDIAVDNTIDGYLDGLRSEGFIDGKNLNVIKKHAGGEIANIIPMLQSLDNDGLDLIAPMTTPVLSGACAALKKTKAVFVHTYDPIGAGAGKNMVEHLANITGVSSFPPISETLKLILETFPKTKTIGTVYNPAEANSVRAMAEARQYLKPLNIKLEEITAASTSEVLLAAQALVSRGVQAIWCTGDNTAVQAIDGVIKTVKTAKIPLFLNDIELVEKGAFAGVGIEWRQTGVAAGKMAARALRGENLLTIPFANIAEKKVVFNSNKKN